MKNWFFNLKFFQEAITTFFAFFVFFCFFSSFLRCDVFLNLCFYCFEKRARIYILKVMEKSKKKHKKREKNDDCLSKKFQVGKPLFHFFRRSCIEILLRKKNGIRHFNFFFHFFVSIAYTKKSENSFAG